MNHPFNEDLQATLDSEDAYDFLPSGTWLSGGCVLLAESLNRLVPETELVSAGRSENRWIPDHAAVRFEEDGEWFYLDYDGIQTEDEFLEKMAWEVGGERVEVRPLDPQELEDWEMDWLRQDVPRFARFLGSELGLMEVDRLSPCWAEGAPSPGPA